MSNLYSKGIERKKEKEESEYLKEIKAKTEYKKKVEDIFETITNIQIEREKVEKKERKGIDELQQKLHTIGRFSISASVVDKFDYDNFVRQPDKPIGQQYRELELIIENILKKHRHDVDIVLKTIHDGYEHLEEIEEMEKQFKEVEGE